MRGASSIKNVRLSSFFVNFFPASFRSIIFKLGVNVKAPTGSVTELKKKNLDL